MLRYLFAVLCCRIHDPVRIRIRIQDYDGQKLRKNNFS
jgi:hypothetical protein